MVVKRQNIKTVLILALIVFTVGNTCFAQKIDAFARVAVSPREGVVRQPYKVTITVHSSTWFAKPLQFTNLQIDNAFIIPFTRTVSGINYINNKKYATLSFYYVVFPYKTGQLTIPALQINAEIPPEGDFKGVPTTIRTKEQSIKINSIPNSKEDKVWTVAENIRVREKWSKPLKDIKVGDVLERTITIDANGTLPTFIQPITINEIESCSIYPKEPELQDKRDNTNVHGLRIEHYSYLFEKEGEILIPEQEVLWWNPNTKRSYKRSLEGKIIQVAPNPNLEMMESLKDSLMAMNTPAQVLEEEKSIPWLRLGVLIALVGIVLFFGSKFVLPLIKGFKRNRAAYLQSEAFYYKQAIGALQGENSHEIIRSLYVWFDKARALNQAIDLGYYLNSEDKNLLDALILLDGASLNQQQKQKYKLFLRNVRMKVLMQHIERTIEEPLNPTH